ncbi:hypothetical protein PoB_003315700 [Plakobranchus ocellatus]|uniref:Integrase zinc-binding domain-containing protein n=1 Tax=Plakobranchus ocellatus TaxID=259542 RepID=A0AAV4AHB0_9GAST|nr:hypothetical protein PoB_003315700 [Plakobranchus ocellatus]
MGFFLFYSYEPIARAKFVSSDCTLVLPKVFQKPVIDMYHSSQLAAHAEITATLERVKADFYFERMFILILFDLATHAKRQKVVRHNESAVTATEKFNFFSYRPATASKNPHRMHP